MTWPETCGAAGGAISLWVNVIECPGLTGIVSSYAGKTSSLVVCAYDQIRYDLTKPYTTFSHFLTSHFMLQSRETANSVNQIMF